MNNKWVLSFLLIFSTNIYPVDFFEYIDQIITGRRIIMAVGIISCWEFIKYFTKPKAVLNEELIKNESFQSNSGKKFFDIVLQEIEKNRTKFLNTVFGEQSITLETFKPLISGHLVSTNNIIMRYINSPNALKRAEVIALFVSASELVQKMSPGELAEFLQVSGQLKKCMVNQNPSPTKS